MIPLIWGLLNWASLEDLCLYSNFRWSIWTNLHDYFLGSSPLISIEHMTAYPIIFACVKMCLLAVKEFKCRCFSFLTALKICASIPGLVKSSGIAEITWVVLLEWASGCQFSNPNRGFEPKRVEIWVIGGEGDFVFWERIQMLLYSVAI